MNWQKFIGIMVSMFGNTVIMKLTDDWRIIVMALVVGIGGLIYGDAE